MSKIVDYLTDYLIDNRITFILSEMRVGGQEESGGVAGRVSNWEWGNPALSVETAKVAMCRAASCSLRRGENVGHFAVDIHS